MVQFVKTPNKSESVNCPNCWGYQEYACRLDETSKKVKLGWILDYVGKKLYA